MVNHLTPRAWALPIASALDREQSFPDTLMKLSDLISPCLRILLLLRAPSCGTPYHDTSRRHQLFHNSNPVSVFSFVQFLIHPLLLGISFSVKQQLYPTLVSLISVLEWCNFHLMFCVLRCFFWRHMYLLYPV